jgi:hypothetical protein
MWPEALVLHWVVLSARLVVCWCCASVLVHLLTCCAEAAAGAPEGRPAALDHSCTGRQAGSMSAAGQQLQACMVVCTWWLHRYTPQPSAC